MFFIKTIIELFDECQIKNIIATLRFMPEKVIFVGYKEVMKKKKMKDLKNFFSSRGLNIELEFQFAERYDYDDIAKTLNRILDDNEDCCFDLTGGKELIMAVMGAISNERNIPMVQFNIRTGNMFCVKNCEYIDEKQNTSSMTISESIALNGGAIVTPKADEPEWDMNDGFRRDIEAMWRINSKDSSTWNKFSKAVAKFGRDIETCGNLTLRTRLSALDENDKKDLMNEEILNQLIRNKLILNYSQKNDVLSFEIKNKQVLRCIIKAGNILELYTYMIALEIAEEENGFYDDVKMGVKIDWDGIENGKFSKIKDTTNEIDVFIMRDLVPLFISCKNGDVGKEALYELNTVAEKFGGEYARKVLMATFISHDTSKKKFLLQRAKDMKIEVIENIDLMSKQEFKREMHKRVK